MQKPSIILKDLVVKTHENTILDGISFSIFPNQHLAILGNADSGKTTLAEAIARKIHDSGTVVIDADNTTMHVRIGFVAQRYLFKNLSGISEFYYQQRFNSFDSDNAPTIFEELSKILVDSEPTNNIDSVLNALGILHVKDASLIQLSSGEHKRFQLAKALLNKPQVLILDNPYTGLDVAVRDELNVILKNISEKGTQIVLIPGTFPIPDFITHVAFLKNKKLQFFGEKENFIPVIESLNQEKVMVRVDINRNKKNEDFESKKPIHLQSRFAYNRDLLPVTDYHFQFETIAELRNICLKYGERIILQNLSWKIMQGEKWILKGRNGVGKSSLLSLITGDHPQAYSNEIYLFGKRRGTGESIWDIKQKVGYISPELHAYFDKNITCFDAIGSGYFDTIGLFKKLSTSQSKNILQWLDFLQASHVSTKPFYSISSSLQRMMLLARALVKNPPLLVLDEPCQGLDQKQSEGFVSLLDDICKDSNRTLIYVSHDETNVPKCIEKVLLLENEMHKIYSIKQKDKLAVAYEKLL